MTESIYKEYRNKYYNPNDNDKKPGDNDNWKSIQKGFHDISEKQLETSAGLTLGKGTEDETSVTAAELKQMKQSGDNNVVISLFYTAKETEGGNPYKIIYENVGRVVNGLPIFELHVLSEGETNYPGTTRVFGYINVYDDAPRTTEGVHVYESNVEYSSAPQPTTENIIAVCHETELGGTFYITEDGKVALA